MGKMLSKLKAVQRRPVAKKPAPSRTVKAPTRDGGTYMSHEDRTAHVIIVTGKMEAGKTFFIGSASDYWPRDKKGNISLPALKMTTLKDMLWFQADARATAGFVGERITVQSFDVHHYQSVHDVSIIKAVKEGLKVAKAFAKACWAAGVRPKIAVDTLSELDYSMLQHHRIETVGNTNKYEAYKRNDAAHGLIYYELRKTGADLFLACHRKKLKEDKDAPTIQMVGAARYGPALYGQGIKAYQWTQPLQLHVRTTPEKRGKQRIWHRKVYLDLNDHDEQTKNRYRAILPAEMEPDLGKILRMIDKGERIEK